MPTTPTEASACLTARKAVAPWRSSACISGFSSSAPWSRWRSVANASTRLSATTASPSTTVRRSTGRASARRIATTMPGESASALPRARAAISRRWRRERGRRARRARRSEERAFRFELRQFVLGRAREQLDHRLRRRALLIQDRPHHLGDRQLDAQPLPEVARRLRGLDALRHLLHPGQHVGERAPLAELDPDGAVAREVAGAGEDEVADAGEPGERERVRS